MISKPTMLHSGEFARRAGVSPDTVRYYERKGLLPTPVRSANGYRVYTSEALERVSEIRSALAVGFTVDQLARVFRARDRGEAPCRHVRQLAAETLAQLDQRRRELGRICADLRQLIKAWDERLARVAPGQQAHLLGMLTSRKHGSRAHLISLFSPKVGRNQKQGADR